MRFTLVFFLSITGSWAMDPQMKLEQAATTPLLRNVNFGIEDEGPPNAESEENDHLPLGANPCVRDMPLDIKGEVQKSSSSTLLKPNGHWPTFINELFERLVSDSWKVDPRSIGRLFLTSKLLNDRIGKLHLNLCFPTRILSLSPHVSEILDVIEDIEKYHHSEGSLIASYIKERFLETPSYKLGVERLSKAERFFHQYSFRFQSHEGSKRINSIVKIHEQKFEKEWNSFGGATPGRLRQFVSSIARDPRTFVPIAIVTLSSAGLLAWELYNFWHQYTIDSQAYQEAFDRNLAYTGTPDYLYQYYYSNRRLSITSGCYRLMSTQTGDGGCFSVTRYCEGDFSPFANITLFSEKIWKHIVNIKDQNYFEQLESHNISLKDIQSVLLDFLHNICSGVQISPYCKDHNRKAFEYSEYVARLKENSPFLLESTMINDKAWTIICNNAEKLDSSKVRSGLAGVITKLYYCDPLSIARGMTQAAPSIWGALTYTTGFIASVGIWLTLTVERCLNLYEDDDA